MSLWKYIPSGWEWFSHSIRIVAGNGCRTQFWFDVWCEEAKKHGHFIWGVLMSYPCHNGVLSAYHVIIFVKLLVLPYCTCTRNPCILVERSPIKKHFKVCFKLRYAKRLMSWILCFGIMRTLYGMWLFQGHYMMGVGKSTGFLLFYSLIVLILMWKISWFGFLRRVAVLLLNLIIKSSLQAVRSLSLGKIFGRQEPLLG